MIEGARYLEGGKLVVYKRNQIYYGRSKLNAGKYVWRSLTTSNLDEALSKARKMYYGLQALSEQGIPVTAKSLSDVIDAYVAFREKDCAQGLTA